MLPCNLSHTSTSEFVAPVLPERKSRRRLKVLHVINGEYYAGAEKVQDLLALHSPQFGIDSGFACVRGDQFPLKRECRDAPLESHNLGHPWHSGSIRAIAKMVENENFDLLHAHTPRSGWAALSAGKISGRPVVYTVHDMFLGQKASLLRSALNRYCIRRLKQAEFATTVSPETTQLAERLGIGKTRRMILNGVPSARDLNRQPPGKTWTLGSVGLIRPCKGIEVLIEAVAKLKQQNCPIKAVIVGAFYTESYKQEVMNLVVQNGVAADIEFPGFTTDVASHLKKFDLFVMPSVEAEGLPMVLLEAMAHGLPMIGADVAGVRDAITHDSDGCIIPNRDPVSLAKTVQKFVSGKIDWLQMSRNATDRHREQFSAQRMAREFSEVYHGLFTE
jgi:glycosyltransferase involved in cell wall biosynthesis